MSGKNVNADSTIPCSRSHLFSGAFLCLVVLFQLPFWEAGQALARDRDTAHRTEELSVPRLGNSPVAPSRQSRPGLHDPQLSEQEADRYRRLFELQDATDWVAADKLIAQVTDMRLMGHVEYQRLMHPSHKATYNELRGWLERYADHAGADKVYQLALKRMARGDRKPPAPTRDGTAMPSGPNGAYASDRGLEVTVPGRARRDRSTNGSAANGSAEVAGWEDNGPVLPTATVTIPTSATVSPPARREPEPPSSVRSGNWTVGMAAWKAGQNDKAAKAFQVLAQSESASPWDRAAGAYWAARSHQGAGRPAEATKWLEQAAQHSRTFYGLIAWQALGKADESDIHAPVLTRRHRRILAEVPAGRRAIALVQAGRRDIAEQELRRIDPRGDDMLEQAVVALADLGRMPALAMRLGSVLSSADGAASDSALYPLPPWEPKGGFTVDRALLFALMRQESRFDPTARSGAGARGLMQLMPSTATYVADKLTTDIGRKPDLYEPETNVTLGQHYVRYLLDQKGIENDLILTIAAYNAGPGNIESWRKRLSGVKDPVLFIESLPVGETRNFAKQVLTNYWIYQRRLGQPLPSLQAIAEGRWPVYMALDADVSDQQVAFNGKD
jgi:soluble lytic murein transglycosylase